jgi:hypothetical protein
MVVKCIVASGKRTFSRTIQMSILTTFSLYTGYGNEIWVPKTVSIEDGPNAFSKTSDIRGGVQGDANAWNSNVSHLLEPPEAS